MGVILWAMMYLIYSMSIVMGQGLGEGLDGEVGEELSNLEGLQILEIKLEGLSKMSEEYVIGNLNIKVGEELNLEGLREDFNRLEELGYFENIEIRGERFVEDGVKIVIRFKELPRIGVLVIEGEDEVEEAEIIEVITLKTGNIYRAEELMMNENKILELYWSKGLVGTNVRITSRGGSDKEVNVIIDIDEGKEVYIESIRIIGTKNLDPDDIYDVIRLKESTLLRGNQVFNEDILKEDRRRIEQYLKTQGYWLGQVNSVRIKKDTIRGEEGFILVIEIEEGDQFRLGGLEIRGNQYFSFEELRVQIELEEGDIYNDLIYRMGIRKIQEMYFNKGYIQMKAVSNHRVNEEERILDVELELIEGEKMHIEIINIIGLEGTRPWVVDRELRIYEGELFNYNKIKKSVNRIKNTRYFSTIDIQPRLGSDSGLSSLDFELTSQKTTTSLSFGAGYGQVGGFSIYQEGEERNFLGTGWLIQEKFELGSGLLKIELGASTRWLLPYLPLTFDVALRYSKDRINSRYSLKKDFVKSGKIYRYDWKAIEFDMIFGYYLTDEFLLYKGFLLSFAKSYGPYQFKLEDIDNKTVRGRSLYNDLKFGLEGSFLSKISHRFGFVYDTRDLVLNTMEGLRLKGAWTFTGLYAGNSRWISWENSYAFYVNPVWKIVFATFASYKMLFDPLSGGFEIRDSDRLRFNGLSELRGWSTSTDQDDIVGLGTKLSLIQEIRFSIFGDILWGVFFADTGDVTDSRPGFPLGFRYWSFGFGFRLQMPVLPLRLYFAKLADYDVTKEDSFDFKRGFKVVFTVGGTF